MRQVHEEPGGNSQLRLLQQGEFLRGGGQQLWQKVSEALKEKPLSEAFGRREPLVTAGEDVRTAAGPIKERPMTVEDGDSPQQEQETQESPESQESQERRLRHS